MFDLKNIRWKNLIDNFTEIFIHYSIQTKYDLKIKFRF